MEFNISIFVGAVLKGKRTLKTPCLIGRSKEAGLTVAHPSMSRKHCELYEDGGILYLRDNSSLNGTLFDGEYIEDPIPLEFNDEFTVGELTFRVSEPEAITPEKRREIADQPTESLDIGEEVGPDADEKPGLATVIETYDAPGRESSLPENISSGQPSAEKPPAEKPSAGKKPKISPKDVRIDIK